MGQGELARTQGATPVLAPLQLTIYVAQHCANCRFALEMAAYIRAHYPHVDLRVIDLETTTQPVPDSVFATPTYLLNGRMWSLGNPSYPQIEAALCGQAAGPMMGRRNEA